MKSIILAGAIAMAFTLFATPGFIWLFKKIGWGQFIRDDGPKTHHTKRGTPTMGGIAIILGAVIAVFGAKFFNGEPVSLSALLVLFMMVGLGLIGFIDDFIKTHRQRSLGLSGWAKIIGQGVVAVAFAIMALQIKDETGWSPASASISIVRDTDLDLMSFGPILGLILFIIWIYFLVAATSNGVNIADGLDGLATGSSAMSIGAYAVIGFWQFNQSCFRDPLIQNCYEVKDSLDLAVVASAIVGSLIGFLWWNTSPAQIFMGDTGSLGLGGALAALAILTHTELLLIPIGGIFVIVTGSVIIQRVYFKITKWRTGTGKRVFLMSPLHHHFEQKGWEQITIVVRFWLIGALCVLSGVGAFYWEWTYA